MPITQFFFKDQQLGSPIKRVVLSTGTSDELTCAKIGPDNITWDDADIYVNSFKQFAHDCELGDSLSFVLSKESIENLFSQSGTDGVRLYLAYCNTDKTIRAFAVAATLNPATKEYDDYNMPPSFMAAGVSRQAMPFLENTRPCPTQCGKTNILNRKLP